MPGALAAAFDYPLDRQEALLLQTEHGRFHEKSNAQC
jgi:hypothetical protein